ncbi:tudor domain-containing protein 5-like [Dermacentor andersoni]|uniref:tudor domain-containing protein 5-like n=1 Tax=Dermacentor andersoni TaxID=34620 RepID=UPI002155EDBE|nr:uncharacterized protein LOC126531317 [Dermacentor andersoni]
MSNTSSATFASIAEPHYQHQDSPSESEHRGNADVRLYLESKLPQSGESVPLTAAVELLRNELKWPHLSSTEVLNACLETAGRLNFQVKEGQVVICRGRTPSLPSSADGEPSTPGPVCADVNVIQPLPYTLENEFFPVLVRHIISPEAIVVNLAGNLSDQLAEMHKAMKLFYSHPGKGGTGGQEIAAQDLVAGALCAYRHVDTSGSGAERWCRGVITGVHQDGMIRVTDVDSGVKTLKPSTSLRQLASHFCTLPRQAITVRLYRLRPAYGGVWGLEACTRLAELVWDEAVMCRLVTYVDDMPAVIMCKTSGPDDIFASNVLIEECLALPLGSSDDEE